MGLLDYVSDLYASLTIQSVEAEEKEESNDEGGEGSEDSGEEKSEDAGEGEDGGEGKEGEESEEGGEEGGDEEEEEEEEEEEPEDIKEKLEEECLRTSQCAPLKHHYDECAERVKQQTEEHGHPKEDCVEEFFHMMHCATTCAAPKLFRSLR